MDWHQSWLCCHDDDFFASVASLVGCISPSLATKKNEQYALYLCFRGMFSAKWHDGLRHLVGCTPEYARMLKSIWIKEMGDFGSISFINWKGPVWSAFALECGWNDRLHWSVTWEGRCLLDEWLVSRREMYILSLSLGGGIDLLEHSLLVIHSKGISLLLQDHRIPWPTNSSILNINRWDFPLKIQQSDLGTLGYLKYSFILDDTTTLTHIYRASPSAYSSALL